MTCNGLMNATWSMPASKAETETTGNFVNDPKKKPQEKPSRDSFKILLEKFWKDENINSFLERENWVNAGV